MVFFFTVPYLGFLALLTSTLMTTTTTTITYAQIVPEFDVLIADMRGDDHRLIRWDVTEHTAERQSVVCTNTLMEQTMTVIIDAVASGVRTTVGQACELLTFCITDHPRNRQVFAEFDGIHQALLELIRQQQQQQQKQKQQQKQPMTEETAYIIAMACHVIYITSFANTQNHQMYIEQGAIPVLAKVILQSTKNTTTAKKKQVDEKDETSATMDDTAPAYVTMWAAAAMANLAASYCGGTEDGRCYWDWMDDVNPYVTLIEESIPMVSDGAAARTAIIQEEGLIPILLEWACAGPVYLEDPNDVIHLQKGNVGSVKTVLPGVTATYKRDESSPNIVPWAAASALKNVAIDPASHAQLESAIDCFCHLTDSPDWLEIDKGEFVLHHLRRADPCWFAVASSSQQQQHDGDEEYNEEHHTLCIDHKFHHAEGYTCSDYEEEPREEDCAIVDRNGVIASTACCACGGGDIIVEVDDGYEDEL